MLQFYYNPGPNPMKVALLLEELGMDYEAKPVDGMRGEQFAPDYLAVNPNGKLPAIVDGDAIVFDSNAILLYLAEKTGKFLPPDTPKARGALLSWLMFVATGVGPYSGQCVHFTHHAPEKSDYAINRFRREVERHYEVVEKHLAAHRFMLGETYTIVDMALWGWARALPRVLGDEAFAANPHLKRLLDEISARPAAKAVEALLGKHTFKMTMDDEARRYMFPQNTPKAA